MDASGGQGVGFWAHFSPGRPIHPISDFTSEMGSPSRMSLADIPMTGKRNSRSLEVS